MCVYVCVCVCVCRSMRVVGGSEMLKAAFWEEFLESFSLSRALNVKREKDVPRLGRYHSSIDPHERQISVNVTTGKDSHSWMW